MTLNKLNIHTSSKVSFNVKKLGFINVKGVLSNLNGEISFSKENVSNSSFNISLSTNTINTGSKKRDEHLKSEDFFNVDNYPTINFRSTSIIDLDGKYLAVGKLTILETTRELEIPFEFENNTITGQFSLNRLDYNLGKIPSFIVSKTIHILINCKVN